MTALPARRLALAATTLLLAACAGTPQAVHAPAPAETASVPAAPPPEVVPSPEAAAPASPEPADAPAPAEVVTAPASEPVPPVVEASGVTTGAEVFARLRARLQGPVCSDGDRAREWQQRYAHHPAVFARKLESVLPLVDFVADEVERSGLPAQFAFIPLVESWYEPGAVGRGGPSGMWQMIGSTARNHGIRISRGYDGRLSPVESTRAALSYLRTLSQMFDGDWQATVMAYNAGEYRLAGALRRSGNRGVSAERAQPAGLSPITYDYVAKLQALSCLVAEPARAHLTLPEATRFERLAAVLVDPKVGSLDQVARHAGVPAPRLRELNPAYRNGRIPADMPRLVLMPAVAGPALANAPFDDASELLAEADPADADDAPAAAGSTAETHRVRNGDTLSQIARQYGIPLGALRRLNRLGSSSRIRPGQVLRLVP
jgi:membrane-bound lytic murein transglycosylase D